MSPKHSSTRFGSRTGLRLVLSSLLLCGLLLTGWPQAVAGQVSATVTENTPDRIVVQYIFGEPTMAGVIIDGREYVPVSLDGEGRNLEWGAPDVPHVGRSLVIPNDGQMAAALTASSFYDMPDLWVAPSKGNLSRTVDPDDVSYEFGSVYGADAFYPGDSVSLSDPYIMRDVRGQTLTVNPVQYNPVTHVLRVYSEMTVEATKVAPGGLNVLTPIHTEEELSLSFYQMYTNHFLNYSPGPRYAPLNETGGMLIICYDAWLTNIQPLADHKTAIGIPSTVVGVSTIGSTSAAIDAYIQAQYDAGNLAFVLLVGDAAQVATPTAAGGASDPSYSLVAGTDNYPDIMVGRFSAETAAQVDTQVQRTIEYENLPATVQAWFWKGTGIGSEFGTGDDGEYDYEHIANIRTLLLAHGYTLVDEIYGTASPTAAQVSTALNNGRGIINYCGHGSDTSWGTTGFSSSDVAALTNDNMLPFIFSVACVNGNFPGQTCFAEAWLRSTHYGEPIGAAGAYMSSINQDWNSPMQAQDHFNAVYAAVTPTYNCYGTLCYAASCSMMDSYGASPGSSGANMFLTWHVFGDPSLRVIGTVQPPTGLRVTPSVDLDSQGFLGGPFTPGSQDYLLQNLNSTPLSYQITVTQPWVSVANGSGTLPGDGSTTVTVSINSAANNLPVGNYSDTVSFVNTTDHDGDATRAVSLAVYWPLPTITTTSLPDGYLNDAYGPVQFQASGGKPPLTWSLPPQGPYAEVDLGSSQFEEVGTAQGWQADNRVWLCPLPFSFPFYGTTHDSVWVCSNGFLHFGLTSSPSPDNDDTIFKAACRIAPMWDDLRTTGSGRDIFIDSGTSGQVTVRWAAETVAVPNVPCNFSVTLYNDGRIRFHYGVENTNLTPTIGISRGSGTQYTLSTYNHAVALTAVNSHEFVPPTLLPPGLNFFAGGILSGTPTQAGTFHPTFKVTDALGRTNQRMIPLVIHEGSQPDPINCDNVPGFDFPAEVPCFVHALLGLEDYPGSVSRCDLNHDSATNGTDIALWVDCVVNSTCP